MALATGGTAVGETRTRSRPISCALRRAAAVGMTSAVPSGKTARTSRARMDSFTFSLRFCRRGGKFLGGYILDYTFRVIRSLQKGESKAVLAGRPTELSGRESEWCNETTSKNNVSLSVHQNRIQK